ncbi:hypothetical protein [Undibacterium sp. SXout20W]
MAKSQRRLLWLSFLGEARKLSGCRAARVLVLQGAIDLYIKWGATNGKQ